MTYALLIVEPRGQREARNAEQGEAVYARMVAFGEGLKARGKLLAAESLKSDAQATRIESRNGKRDVVDGPFSEAKEMIGGSLHVRRAHVLTPVPNATLVCRLFPEKKNR